MLASAVDPSGQLYVLEMGPLGGDELNLIKKGANYGWPVVSNGDNYDKSPIPDHPTRKEFEAPIKIVDAGDLTVGRAVLRRLALPVARRSHRRRPVVAGRDPADVTAAS